MRLLVDAQLPFRLAGLLSSLGHDVVHTRDNTELMRLFDAAADLLADAFVSSVLVELSRTAVVVHR